MGLTTSRKVKTKAKPKKGGAIVSKPATKTVTTVKTIQVIQLEWSLLAKAFQDEYGKDMLELGVYENPSGSEWADVHGSIWDMEFYYRTPEGKLLPMEAENIVVEVPCRGIEDDSL